MALNLSLASRALRLIQFARAVVIDIRGMGRNLMELVQLEAKLAATSAVFVAILSAGALLLVMTGWILLIAALVAWIADNWLSLPLTLLLVAVVALAGAVPLALIIRRQAVNLTFPATRRQLQGLNHGD